MNTTSMIRSGVLAAAVLGAAATAAAAQVSPTPRALGMGGAYVATARGHETLFLNPANLGLPGTPYWSIAIPQLNFAGGVAGPTFSETWDIVQYGRQSTARRQELLAQVPRDGMGLDLHVRAPLAVIQAGHLVFGAAYGAVADQSVGKDLVDLVVNGYQNGRTDYAVGNTAGSRATYFDFAAGYGRRVGPVSVGATAHFYLGRTLSRTRLFEPKIDPSAESIEIEYREVLVRGGQGYGLDVGAAYQPIPNLTVSAVVANAFSRMRWNEDLLTRDMTITQRDFGGTSMYWEEKFSDFSRSDRPFDPAAEPLTAFETARDLYAEAWFPATLRSGVAYHLPASRTTVEASYQKHLTDGRLGGPWEQVVSAGVQQKIPLLVLRAGAATNLDGGSLLSAGVTLGAMEIGVAKLGDEGADGTPRNGWMASFGLNIGTRTKMP